MALVLARSHSEAVEMLSTVELGENYSLTVIPTAARLARQFNHGRIEVVLARRLSSLGENLSQLEKNLGLIREHEARLVLVEQVLDDAALGGAFSLIDALQEVRGNAVRKGIMRSPSRSGRPRTDFDIHEATRMRLENHSFRAIGKALNVSSSTVSRRLRDLGNCNDARAS